MLAINERVDAGRLCGLAEQVDVVVDAWITLLRALPSIAAIQAGKALVSGAAIRMEGRVAVFDLRNPDPCYRCLYRPGGSDDDTCSANGVMAPVVASLVHCRHWKRSRSLPVMVNRWSAGCSFSTG